MYIVTNTTKIKKNEAHQLIERFDKVGQVESMEGFIDLEVLETKKLRDHDEVVIVTRWEDEASFKKWMKSDAFKNSHKHEGEGKRPDFILDNEIGFYEVKVVRRAVARVS